MWTWNRNDVWMVTRRVLLGGLVTLSVAQHAGVVAVTAATVPGASVTISGLDDASATVNTQVKTGIGKILGIGVAILGALAAGGGYYLPGAMGVVAGAGMAFIPGIVSTAFDAAPAAEFGVVVGGGQFDGHWWTPLLALGYMPLLAFRVVQDPVCMSALLLSLLAVRMVRQVRTGEVA